MQIFVAPLLVRQGNGGQNGIPDVAVVAVVDHVLEDDHAQLVALVVEFVGLNLDVLAEHIEAQRLHGENIVGKTLGAGRRQQTVGPVTLVQQTVEEVRFAVETQALILAHLLDLQTADGEIALHPVLRRGHGEVVEIGVLRGPETGILRGDGHGTILHFEVTQTRHSRHSVHGRLDGDGHGIAPVFHVQFPNVMFGHGFQPHGLPDAGHGGVPHAAPLHYLLAVGEGLVSQVVITDQLDGVFLSQKIRDVKCDMLVAALMGTDFLTVDRAFQDLVRRTDVQQHPPPVKALRQAYTAAVMQRCTLAKMPSHARQDALRAEGHPDVAPVILRRKCPCTIQIQPIIPAHSGSGICFPGRCTGFQQRLSLFCHQLYHDATSFL